MINALWTMGTRGHELANLLKQALDDYNLNVEQLSDARYLALKNTTSMIYQKFWDSGDTSIERYVLDGFNPKYAMGFNEMDDNCIKPNLLLSQKVTQNRSLLFNKQGQLRKITSVGYFNTDVEKLNSKPTVYVTNSEVWVDKSNQSQENRTFSSQGRFWARWETYRDANKGKISVTVDGNIPQITKLTDRNGPKG